MSISTKFCHSMKKCSWDTRGARATGAPPILISCRVGKNPFFSKPKNPVFSFKTRVFWVFLGGFLGFFIFTWSNPCNFDENTFFLHFKFSAGVYPFFYIMKMFPVLWTISWSYPVIGLVVIPQNIYHITHFIGYLMVLIYSRQYVEMLWKIVSRFSWRTQTSDRFNRITEIWFMQEALLKSETKK